jgi:ubiquinone/menaquinone biosynthesis C-methylase UbiE
MTLSCPACQQLTTCTVDTYKHLWHWCDCGNVTRERRSSYAFAESVPLPVSERVLPDRLISMLYPDEFVRSGERHFYDYYAQAAQLELSETKWNIQYERIASRFRQWDIELSGRKFLDISGGPGFLTREVAKVAERAVVTEFSSDATAGMNKHLGVEAVTFDYNSDQLSRVLDGPFDVILIDYSINFCGDLAGFAKDLLAIISPGAKVYVSLVVPTLGCCLRWQFDEYTYNHLWSARHLRSSFEEVGFSLQEQTIDPAYGWRDGLSRKARWVRAPFDAYYRAKASPRPVAQDMFQRSVVHLYSAAQR